MESDSSHDQSTAAASSGDSDWEQQQSGADPGSSEQEESEAESEEEWQQSSRHTQGQHRHRTEDGRAGNTPASAAGEQDAEGALHAPYSHMLWCDAALQRAVLTVAGSLCTDIADVNTSSGSGTAPVQVTVEVHAASWDVRQYILSQLQQQAPEVGQQQQQQGQPPAAQAGSSTAGLKVFGPYAATLSKFKRNTNLAINQLQQQHEPQTYTQHLADKPHCVVLQERVPGSDPPHFRLHVKPGTPDKPKNNDAQAISRAGEGRGLQVAPGSVSEVSNPCALSRSCRRLYINIPKVLICSQLSADTTYPLDISLRVLPPPDGQEGQWTARISAVNSKSRSVRLAASHPLSAYTGRSIGNMSLSQDRQLTVTFAPAPSAAAHTSMPSPPPQQHQSRRPLKRQGMSTAAAAAGGTSGQTAAAAAVTRKKPRLTKHQKAAAAATGAVPPSTRSTGQAARAQRATGRAAKAAAVDSSTPPAAAARKKRRQAQQQQHTTATPGAATAAAADPPAAPVPIKQEADSSTPPPAAANTGLLFWHMGELSSASSSSGDDDEDDSTGGAAQPAAGNLPGAPAGQDPSAAFHSAAAVGAGPAASAPAASTSHGSFEVDTAAAAAAAAAGDTSSQQAVWSAGEQQQPGRGRELGGMGGAAEPATVPVPAAPAAPTAAPAPVPEAPAAAGSLPARLLLLPASTPAEIEVQLVGLMADSLMPLLDPGEYYSIMQQLSELFAPDRVVDGARLRCRYAYVQAAVRVGQLCVVLKELNGLIRAC